jgi:hypothetical protein
VIVPDLFYGDSIDFSQFGNIDIMKWLGGEYSDKKVAHTPESIDPIIEASIKKMKEALGFKVKCHRTKKIERREAPKLIIW